MIKILVIDTQNHEEKMAKHEKVVEQQKRMIEDNKIKINKHDYRIKKYAKDIFNNRNRKPERGNDSRINSSFVLCTYIKVKDY